MTYTIIITFCSLLLIAYIFNLTASKTSIPSVILLLLLGWGIKQFTLLLKFELPDFTMLLPILATIGLVLIVLEGSLELDLNKSKIGLVKKSLLGALLPMIGMALLLAFLFQYYGDYSFKISLINAIPFCIISSAIAIPSARNLTTFNREFTTYESSLSDILGVLIFNFIVLNESIDLSSFGFFGLKFFIMIAVSFIATIGLSLLLSKIDHHVKFVPIILLVILIYSVSKVYHLPALIFILIFGLSIGNLGEFRRLKWITKFNTDEIRDEIQKFKALTIEGAFLIRALFFILFGYMLKTSDILNTKTLIWSLCIVTIIFVLRAIQLKFSKLELTPLLFVAPRGLITILLFLAIDPSDSILLVNKSLVIQVIILSALIMTFGILINTKKEEKNEGTIE
ncbi:cation:proton antiporter domain-containing protein [Snuella sedimenti]|uniref:Cation:proton antiporter n=1 Tax=Snuella sedimenti TaxID=2798802 RepID=A0A8J7J6E0_9FLAO|nr:cation:proton antiporter [Snuella sedimenti]MBJ6369803.1 cation:proton antiporter [Snuella sedimenti]